MMTLHFGLAYSRKAGNNNLSGYSDSDLGGQTDNRKSTACVSGYFNNEAPDINEDEPEEYPVFLGYKAILDSNSTDETLALHARWEPRHSRHKHFPGKQYVKLGGTPRHVRALFKDLCTRLAEEILTVLKELANRIHNRYQCSPKILYDHLHEALRDLNTAFKAQPRLFIGPATQTSEIIAFSLGEDWEVLLVTASSFPLLSTSFFKSSIPTICRESRSFRVLAGVHGPNSLYEVKFPR
ncbi:hypothetical protein AgCh_005234 [Apium graveolens]